MSPLAWLLRTLIFGTYLAIQVYIYRKAKSFLSMFDSEAKTRSFINFLRLLFVVMNFPLLFFMLPLHQLTIANYLFRPLGVWISGTIFCFLVLSIIDLLIALKKLIWKIFPLPAVPSESRRKFLKITSSLIATAPVGAFAYGAASANEREIKVERLEIPIKDLPEGLSGLGLCQLSDIHFESFIDRQELEQAVRLVNGLNPDLVFLTGDFITYQLKNVDPFVEIFSKLNAQHGIYGCLGNHEIYTKSENRFTKQFKKKGIEVLRQQTRDLKIRGERLRLAGIDYIRGGVVNPRVVGFLEESAKCHPTILLSHHPNVFPHAAGAGVDLTLAGHTHGGQIVFKLGEFKLSPSQIVSPYIAGPYRLGDSILYVNRGLGTVGPPIRINAPPEISLVKLVRR